MRQSTTRILAPLFLLAVVISAAGCGSSKKSSTTSTTTTTAAAATTSTTTTTTGATTSPSVASSGAAALGALESAGNCKTLANLGADISQAMTGTGTVDVQKEAQLLQQFAQKAPAAIKPDFQTIANDVSKIASVIGNYKPGTTPSPATIAKLSQLGSEINTTDLQKAATDIGTWAAANCHS